MNAAGLVAVGIGAMLGAWARWGLGADLPVELEFVAGADRIEKLLALLEQENLGLFCVQSLVETGLAGKT